MTRTTIFGSVLVFGSLLGCSEPLKDAQRVEELRVLGAELSVDADPSRATPLPGEAVTVEWLIADPTGLPPLAVWSMRACIAADSNYGIPFCLGEPVASAEASELSDLAPVLRFAAPSSDDLGEATRLVVLGLFCDGGAPNLDDDFLRSTCDGATTVQRASFDISMGNQNLQNRNPDLGDASIEFAGEVWAEGAPDCSAGTLPSVQAGSGDHSITLTLSETAREPVERELSDLDLESLQISHVATLGLLDRRFSDIAPADDNFAIELTWEAPDTLPEPELASFYFVVRDDRGGTAWLTRSLCIEP